MSLPNYIVNLNELSNLFNQSSGSSGSDGALSIGKQRVKGMRLQSSSGKLKVSEKWHPENDIFITGIKLGISNRDMWNGNKMNVLLKNKLTFDGVFFKKESDYKNFRVFEHIRKDEPVQIDIIGVEPDVEVWVDVDYINDFEDNVIIGCPERNYMANIIVRFLDKDTMLDIKPNDIYHNKSGLNNFTGDEIHGWVLLEPKTQTVKVDSFVNKIVDFIYKKEIPEPEIPEPEPEPEIPEPEPEPEIPEPEPEPEIPEIPACSDLSRIIVSIEPYDHPPSYEAEQVVLDREDIDNGHMKHFLVEGYEGQIGADIVHGGMKIHGYNAGRTSLDYHENFCIMGVLMQFTDSNGVMQERSTNTHIYIYPGELTTRGVDWEAGSSDGNPICELK